MKRALLFVPLAYVGTAQAQFVDVTNLTGRSAELVAEHAPFGLPGSAEVLIRQGYVVSYDTARRVPRWVAYHVTPEYRQLPPRTGRFSTFRTDPDVPDPVRDGDYTGLFADRGYARGHIVPYAVMGGDRDEDNRLAAEDDDDALTIFQANFMSNIAPQHHTAFNGSGGMWFALERFVQDDLVRDAGGEVWVYAGTVFGLGTPERVGPDGDIHVPPMFFKIVVRIDPDVDAPHILAFLFPHHRLRHGGIEDYLVSVDVIEALTGLDFFTELADELEAVLEDADTFGNWLGEG